MRTVGQLTIALPTDCEIEMRRTFEAPRALVWQAWTRPEYVSRWLGAFGSWTMAVCEIDLRVGGGFRFVWKHENGQAMGMHGVYREIDAPERIVSTEVFDDPWYEGEGLVTLHLSEANGRTTLVEIVCYQSKQVRDAVLATPMEQGVAASFDQLEALLPTWA